VGADDAIRERLSLLRNEVAYLRGEQEKLPTLQTYHLNPRAMRAVERGLQVAIEMCLDIGRRIIALEGFAYPRDNQSVFRILAAENVIPPTLLPNLLKMAGFRNLLVHEYTHIDDRLVFTALHERLTDFDAYARAIRDYLG
jgi:uncharacterized protein YutE (UPF0331/DUF86 family)